MTIHNLQKFFEPDTVAVIGASEAEGSVGTTLLQNLLRGFEGKTFAVNPNRESALGQPTYPRVSSLPESPDLAVIATPAPTIPSIVEECGKEGIPAAVIVSSGFSEVGEEGSKLQDAIEDRRKKFGMRILGPNCLGFIRPPTQLNVSFAREVPSAGHVAFISQSGAMGASLIDWSTESRIGFSALISIGNILDVGFSDLIDYFGKDPTTKSIILYMETLKDPDAFIRAARPVARRKPIICLKGGRHLKSRPLVSSHIGLSPRRDEMYEALFKRIGITRVPTLEDLFACSEILAHDSLPDDSSLAVVTNANGPAILALDSILDQGGKVASLTEDTRGKLCEVLPYQVNLTNPLDLLGDANRARYEECGRIVSEDEHVDALLFIYCPQGEASARDAAEAVVAVEKNTKIPVFTAWIGGKEAREGRRLLRENGIVTSTAPEKAARAYLYLYQYLRNLEMLYQTPEYLESSSGDYSLSKSIKKSAQEGPTRLPRAETQKLLRSYGLNPLSQRPVDSFSEVKEFASSNSFPLALKGSAGLEIIVRSRNQLDSAFSKMNEQESRLYIREKIPKGSLSLRISSYRDKLFGSLIMIEPTAKNTPRESSTVGFPPLNQVLARRLLEESGIDRRLGNTTKNQSSSLR
ncbi:CoA-binding protein, partial [Candidatus Bipolaricaulota bacterium]|nr:CoA-binding protein [Candidatus Bipolaricaulota bacterium]